MMSLRQNSKSVSNYQIGWLRMFNPGEGGYFIRARKSFLAQVNSQVYVHSIPAPYDTVPRYCVANISDVVLSSSRGTARKLFDLGFFKEGPGWYTYIQYGDATASPLIFKLWKCDSYNQAAIIARARAERGEKIQKRTRDTVMARIALLGTVHDKEKPDEGEGE